MKKSVIILCCCVAAAGAVAVRAADEAPLEGTYTFISKTLLDPPPGEKEDRVAIHIKGDGARDIYKAMPVPEQPDLCYRKEDAVLTKSAGGLNCYGNDKMGYFCGVAIKLDNGATANAVVC